MVGSSTFAASGGMEVETSAGFLSSSCPAMVATDFAMRVTGVRKSEISMKASTIAANQKRCSCVSSASRQSKAIRSSRIFFDLCAIRSGSEWMVRKTTPVRMMQATTNTNVKLKSTSVSPGAVMKNGKCVVAIGLGDADKDNLLPIWRGAAAASQPWLPAKQLRSDLAAIVADLHIHDARKHPRYLVRLKHLQTELDIGKHDVGCTSGDDIHVLAVLFPGLDLTTGKFAPEAVG